MRTDLFPTHSQAKMANFHHLAVTRGLHFNDSLSASKAFRNPRMYTTLVAYLGVNETDSGWDKSVWDPNGLNINATASRIGSYSFYFLSRRQIFLSSLFIALTDIYLYSCITECKIRS